MLQHLLGKGNTDIPGDIMKKYKFKGKTVYIFGQTGTQVIYSIEGDKDTPLRSVGLDSFFKRAVEITDEKVINTVVGRKPKKKAKKVIEEEEVVEQPIIVDKTIVDSPTVDDVYDMEDYV